MEHLETLARRPRLHAARGFPVHPEPAFAADERVLKLSKRARHAAAACSVYLDGVRLAFCWELLVGAMPCACAVRMRAWQSQALQPEGARTECHTRPQQPRPAHNHVVPSNRRCSWIWAAASVTARAAVSGVHAGGIRGTRPHVHENTPLSPRHLKIEVQVPQDQQRHLARLPTQQTE